MLDKQGSNADAELKCYILPVDEKNGCESEIRWSVIQKAHPPIDEVVKSILADDGRAVY